VFRTIRTFVPLLAVLSVPLAALGLMAGSGAAAAGSTVATAPYSQELFHFSVHVGPADTESCDIIGELFTPAEASPTHRVPAILTTNGFGGSYTDQFGLAEYMATQGYVVLSYSGLGFGASGCSITLDDQLHDGEAASQLVSFLGGENGIAFHDAAHTQAVAGLQDVVHDATDHDGQHDQYDPRVGMIGGSYGGEVQFAAASVDPRIDTIIPQITWNNLAYSLAPNNADASPSVASYTPGVVKSSWALLFSADGVLAGLENASVDPSRLIGCPNFATWVCPALFFGAALGYPYPAMEQDLETASVSDYMSNIKIPVLLMQGEDDTLFNLNEGIANYQALKAQGTPVDMVWQSWGHSDSTPAPGEYFTTTPDATTQYETGRILDWFNHYLKGQNVSTGPGFAFFENWVTYHGNAAPAYASAASYPLSTSVPFYLSGGQQLVSSSKKITASTQTFVTPGAGLPSTVGPLDAVGGPLPDETVPGTSVSWTTAPLSAPIDVVGPPVLTVKVDAPSAALTQLVGPAGQLVVFAKIYDVAPNGKASLINGLVAPARISNVNEPVRITLPGIVHRFGAHDRIEIVLAGGDINYRGGNLPNPVTVASGSASEELILPTGP
jgi:hypothetical protein